MMVERCFKIIYGSTIFVLIIFYSCIKSAIAEVNEYKFNPVISDQLMVRIGPYYVNRASTEFTVLSGTGVGVGISYDNDLGGETRVTIPKFDMCYRFNDRHRIEFMSFTLDRKGNQTLDAGLTIGDQVYNVNETIASDIEYKLFKFSYAYSFYHSSEVELSLSAGLNYTSYNLSYDLDVGGKAASVGVTAPLPMFGLRMFYTINPKWSVRYLADTFFIEFSDSIIGTLLNYGLDIEYRLSHHIAVGAGIARVSTDVSINDDDWRGGMADSHRGFTLYTAVYFY